MIKRLYKTALIALGDLFLANLGVFVALGLYYITDLSAMKPVLVSFLIGVPLLCVSVLIAFIIMHLYRIIWKYAGTVDLLRIGVGLTVAFVVYVGLHHLVIRLFHSVGENFETLPVAVYVLGGFFALVMITSVRVVMRIYKRDKTETKLDDAEITRVMVVGGGNAGALLLKDLHINEDFSKFRAVCVIDDAPEKLGKMVYGVRIVGNCDTIVENAKKFNVDEIVFAIPTASAERRAEVLKTCTDTGCVVKTLPPFAKMLEAGTDLSDGGKVHGALRSVNVEDLLGREPIKVDLESILDYIKDKTVLVTGGGGSIGSELCRQVAAHKPKRLIIFDIYENNAYDIQNELKRKYPELELETLIGSVREERRLDEIFAKYRPDIVYHAAAHKHVPLMEDSPKEAVKNNVFGTYNVAKVADKYGVKRFVMISTDKAVNPTNVMGATKRVCEMIVQTMNKKSKTEFITVRFGNVLGSNGSVIPFFEKQIAAGGPVTVTDPNIVRYFMTIPEAVSLVLQAGAYGKGGEIFVLDMGKPVKILTLAENMIKLSGFEPYRDIEIKFIGLRPGEKLYEEMLMAEEGLQTTPNKLIHIGKPIDVTEEQLEEKLNVLKTAIDNDEDMREAIKKAVPTYHPADN